jgi:serine/threonine protein kinase
MSSSSLQLQGESKLWSLKKQRILGKGSFGMATLYEDTATGELVVVKDLNLQCIKKAADIEAVHNEIQILKKTASHPNIVHYLDSSFDGKFSMQIIMEFCDAGDLSDLIEKLEQSNTPMPQTQVLSLITQILMGLHHLHHDHRILHRDLKPQNIFLTSGGVAKIGDFGVSTVLSQNVEFAKTFCGSPFYLAPELCEEKRYNGKADLWSVGVMLYEMMALRRPFDGKNLVTLVTQITKAEYPPISDALDFALSLKDLAYSLLQVNPDTRPTLKRLLRSSLIANGNAQKCLPRYCTQDRFYVDHFGKLVAPSPQQGDGKRQLSSQRPAGAMSAESQLLAEMEAWAAKDKDDLIKTEIQRGMKGSDLVDTRLLDGRQVHEMSSSAKNASSSQSNAQPSLQLTQSTEDATWNDYYDDDDFEDDDDVVCEPSMVPMEQRTFRFS